MDNEFVVNVDDTERSLAAGIARHFLLVIMKEATKKGCLEITKKEWVTIKKWLGAKSDELSDKQINKWEDTYLSFLAQRPEFSTAAKRENWKKVEISDEIQKILEGWAQLQPKVKAKHSYVEGVIYKINSRFFKLSKRERLGLISVLCWGLFVIIRTGGSFEFLGYDFRRWDDDSFWGNLIAPPLIIFLSYKLYNWIKNGRNT